MSDLDYHLIGPAVSSEGLSLELDLHCLSEARLESELLAGDDFIQWSLRFGLVAFDDGTTRRALELLERRPWPSVTRKRAQAVKSLELADRFVATGDEDGARVQTRTALSLAARTRLLAVGVFPLSRAELPAQLRALGLRAEARALWATIFDTPSLSELAEGIEEGRRLVAEEDRTGELEPGQG